jgi:hypothetical protein
MMIDDQLSVVSRVIEDRIDKVGGSTVLYDNELGIMIT